MFSLLSRRLLITTILGVFSFTAFAESGREDYDLDDDGLIEINDLVDLDEIRNNLDGTSLYGNSQGCPEAGCNGFELTTDLDFDTNADGVMDENDTYWNDGEGWEPIGTYSYYNPDVSFSGVFEGNGFVIRNLYIRSSRWYQGLFGATQHANIRNLILTGPLTSVTSHIYVGVLAGWLEDSEVTDVYASGSARSQSNFTGGIAGFVSNTSLQRVQSAVAVEGSAKVGG